MVNMVVYIDVSIVQAHNILGHICLPCINALLHKGCINLRWFYRNVIKLAWGLFDIAWIDVVICFCLFRKLAKRLQGCKCFYHKKVAKVCQVFTTMKLFGCISLVNLLFAIKLLSSSFLSHPLVDAAVTSMYLLPSNFYNVMCTGTTIALA